MDCNVTQHTELLAEVSVLGNTLGSVVLRVSNDCGSYVWVQRNIVEGSRDGRSVHGDIDGPQVLSDVDIDIKLTVLVVGADDIFTDVQVTEVTSNSVGLVGGVLQSFRDVVVLDSKPVLVKHISGNGGVAASRLDVVSLLHLLFAESRHGMLADVFTTFTALSEFALKYTVIF